jgi:hypothetical protein
MGPSYYLRPDLILVIGTLQIHHNQTLLRNAVSIAKALKVSKSLQELDMSCRYYVYKHMDDINDDLIAIAFSDMHRVNKSLTSLNLSSNWFTTVGIIH